MTEDETAEIAAPIKAALGDFQEWSTARSTETERQILPYAIKIGTALNEAKEKVEQKGERWKPWIDKLLGCFSFSYRTASDYMLLARYPDLSQSSASIAEALKKIGAEREARGEARKKPTPKPVASAPDKDDDDVEEDDTEQEEEQEEQEMVTLVLKAKGKYLEPEKIAKALKEALPIADLRELARYIDELLSPAERPQQQAPASPNLSSAPSPRRI